MGVSGQFVRLDHEGVGGAGPLHWRRRAEALDLHRGGPEPAGGGAEGLDRESAGGPSERNDVERAAVLAAGEAHVVGGEGLALAFVEALRRELDALAGRAFAED